MSLIFLMYLPSIAHFLALVIMASSLFFGLFTDVYLGCLNASYVTVGTTSQSQTTGETPSPHMLLFRGISMKPMKW
jgi:hypothetical protein